MAGVEYQFVVTESFWENFYRLDPAQKEAVRAAWEIFKTNPFDGRLGTHKLQRLAALMKRVVYAVKMERNLWAVFYIHGDTVMTFNIGSHDIYKA